MRYGREGCPGLNNGQKIYSSGLEKDLKMTRASSDACMYYSRNDTGWVLLCTEVDDLIITGTDEDKIQEIRKYFEAKFKMKDWDTPVRSFLGININYDIDAGRFEMDVEDKIRKLDAFLEKLTPGQITH